MEFEGVSFEEIPVKLKMVFKNIRRSLTVPVRELNGVQPARPVCGYASIITVEWVDSNPGQIKLIGGLGLSGEECGWLGMFHGWDRVLL